MMLKLDFTNSAKIDIDLYLYFVKANNVFQLALSSIFRDLKKKQLIYILYPPSLFIISEAF